MPLYVTLDLLALSLVDARAKETKSTLFFTRVKNKVIGVGRILGGGGGPRFRIFFGGGQGCQIPSRHMTS